MGSFIWMKADNLTNVANIVYDKPFKMLIPEQFGGGFIKDHYQDYGYIGTKDGGSHEFTDDAKYDMYELIAFWNADMPYKDGIVKDYLKFDGWLNPMKEIDEYTNKNRLVGINIGCGNTNKEEHEKIDSLEFPLKLVSCSYKGTYEDCEGRSYSDPNQGWFPLYR